jgi:Mn-dependent DtxR family transcriptional regulator
MEIENLLEVIQRSAMKRKIIIVLSEYKELTNGKIAGLLKVHPGHSRKYLNILIKAGIVGYREEIENRSKRVCSRGQHTKQTIKNYFLTRAAVDALYC